jgi:hypothetical protein
MTKDVAEKPKKNYLNNKSLLAEVEKSLAQGKMTNELAKMFMLLCAKYAQKGTYVNYTYNEDMQAFALMTLCKSWKSFNPQKSKNPFAYYTQTIKHAFYQYLNIERDERDIRDRLLMEQGDNPSYGFTERYDDEHSRGTTSDELDYGNSGVFNPFNPEPRDVTEEVNATPSIKAKKSEPIVVDPVVDSENIPDELNPEE